jgi:hypothetical protein
MMWTDIEQPICHIPLLDSENLDHFFINQLRVSLGLCNL